MRLRDYRRNRDWCPFGASLENAQFDNVLRVRTMNDADLYGSAQTKLRRSCC